MSSSSSRACAAGGGGREAAAGGCDGRGGGGGGFDAGAALGLATGAPGTGGFAAGGGGLGAGGGADGVGLATAGAGGRGGFDVGVEKGGFGAAPAGMGGRAITIVLPAAGETAGAETAGLGGFELRAGGAGGFGGPEEAGAMTGFAFGFARMVLTCSMSFALSNGFGMCPFAPTAIALAGSMGAGPPSSSTGTSFNEASPRTR